MYRILIVEDDVNLSANLKAQLQEEGYYSEQVYDGSIADRMISRENYDLILLDINIPGINGYDLCKRIRAKNIHTPVLMLTAFGEVEDKVNGFESGADDYLSKPFFMKELMARIKVLIKRQYNSDAEPDQLSIDTLLIFPQKKLVSRNNMTIKLTAREFSLLLALAKANGNPVSKKDLMKHVWGTSVDVNTNTVEVFINSLRNKIDRDFPVKLLHTRTGFGYCLSAAYEA
jgi:DNA-binding response OmpR family regulator